MKESKQVIVIRKDLNMSAGKLSAQVAHASLCSFINSTQVTMDCYDGSTICSLDIPNKSAVKDWINGSYGKVVVYVKSEQQLKNIYKKAKEKNLPCSLIQDEGRTEFNGVETFTTLGIGPCYIEDFENITNKLRLFTGEIITK